MRVIYLILICFAAPVAALIAWLRGLRDPLRRERLADRFGKPQLQHYPAVLWVHAASMGEVQAGVALVRQLLARYPSHHIVMTTMTTTGAARVKSLFPDRVTHCFLPYDLPFAVKRFLTRVQPQLAMILETELWPNLLLECRHRSIPVIVASARISLRTADRYRRFASLFRDGLADATIAAQTPADAERFKALGARNVHVIGNIKFDIKIPESARQQGAAFRTSEGANRFVWVAGSTHEGEEVAILAAHRRLVEQRPNGLLILAPRHPQRFGEVRRLLQVSGVSFVTRSSGNAIAANVSILLVDTMGELLGWYAAADAAFVGGSLVPVGGHNLLEPAALGVPVISGPFMSNAQDVAELLWQAGGATQVLSAAELGDHLCKLECAPDYRQELGRLALQTVDECQGAVARIFALAIMSSAGSSSRQTLAVERR